MRILVSILALSLLAVAQCDTPNYDADGHLYCSTLKFAVPKPANATGKFLRDDNTWSTPSVLPSGLILLTVTSCPAGTSEVTALDGKMVKGTLVAHGDAGTTGGNATITPAGTNSTVSFTPAGTNGTATTGATSAGTPSGTNSATATSGNCATTNIAAGTGSATACKATAPNLTVSAETFTGTAMSTHTHTVPAETFTGTSGTIPAETFTGTPVDPSPPYVKVIFCSVN